MNEGTGMQMDAETIAREVFARVNKSPPVRPVAALWTAEQCWTYLGLARRTFYEVSALPDFPKPTRVTDSGGSTGPSNKRWFAEDIVDWLRSRQG